MEEMLQTGLDKADKAIEDANNKLNDEISKVNDKLQTGMDEVYDVLTEQKNEQEKNLNDLSDKVQEGLKILEDSVDENRDQMRSEISLLQIEVGTSSLQGLFKYAYNLIDWILSPKILLNSCKSFAFFFFFDFQHLQKNFNSKVDMKCNIFENIGQQ